MDKPVQFPSSKVELIIGKGIVLRGDDIDTDRIIPARFLKCVSFRNLGEQVFADDREESQGNHPFDKAIYKDASILVVNDNFGCGSSREHAPQALMRWGIRGIIGQSFAEIFYGNCLALGIPCATSSSEVIKQIQDNIENFPNELLNLNLHSISINKNNKNWKLQIEKGPLEMLKSGRWDATSQLISNSNKVNDIKRSLPYLNNFIIGKE
tara:strand:- start:301 stop:930 length:630 start_codon:yes stop_codon:yes gene_type:complete